MTKISNNFKNRCTFNEILIQQHFVCFPRALNMTIPHRSFQIKNSRRLAIIKQILHHQNVHFHCLASNGILGTDLIKPQNLGQDGGKFVEEGLRHVLEICWGKFHKRVHLISVHLFYHKSIIYCQLNPQWEHTHRP